MAEKDYLTPIILLGGLAVGAYFLFNWLKQSPLGQSGEALSGGISTISKTTETIIKDMNTPIIPEKQTATIGVKTPSPIDYVFPPAGIPKYIENFVVDKTGSINPMVAPIKATATVMSILGMGKKQTLKAESKSTIPIVTKTTTGVSILRPLEIVNTGKLIKSVALESRKSGGTVTGSLKISPSKIATVTKSPGVTAKTIIQGSGAYKKPGGM